MSRPFYPPQATRVRLHAKYNATNDLGQSETRRRPDMPDFGAQEISNLPEHDTSEMLGPCVTGRIPDHNQPNNRESLHVPDWMVHDSPDMLYPWVTEAEFNRMSDAFHIEVLNKLARKQLESNLLLEIELELTISKAIDQK